ncbi:MAG: hypothetical protein IT158_20175 [Bryobacterales bacterium]|nr:hypothetical protein [Bryobacterales bacterium]
MTLNSRDRRALILLGAALPLILLLRAFMGRETASAAAAPVEDIPRAEKRLERLRQLAAGVPAKEAVLKAAAAELAGREKGILKAETAAQAQAELLQVVRRVAQREGIDVRGGEFGPVRALGDDYGEVTVAVTFECQIERLVNLLASLTAEPQLLATHEIRIASANAKDKTVGIRLALSGVVPRQLVPARKGVAALF